MLLPFNMVAKMWCNSSKPGTSFVFSTNSVFCNFIGNFNLFAQFDILVQIYSKGDFFQNENQFKLKF